MTGKRPFFLIVLLAGAILLCCNMFVQSRLDESIRKNKLIDEQFVEGAPPLVAFTTVALGGFRGLVFFYHRLAHSRCAFENSIFCFVGYNRCVVNSTC